MFKDNNASDMLLQVLRRRLHKQLMVVSLQQVTKGDVCCRPGGSSSSPQSPSLFTGEWPIVGYTQSLM